MDECQHSTVIIGPIGSIVLTCKDCGQSKPETEFYIQYKRTGYRQRNCKVCHRIAVDKRAKKAPEKVWQNRPENRDKIRANARAKYREDPQKEIARHREWRQDNPHVINAWREANKEVLSARTKASIKRWHERNPKGYLINMQNRRAKTERPGCKLSIGLWDKLMAFQSAKCPYCKVDLNSVKVHMDHVIPLARGGAHADSNMQLTCITCNHRKHAKDPILFGREMGIFIPSTELAI